MPMPLILLVGPAGSGKDSVGAVLAKTSGFKCIAQADPIKKIAKEVFDFTDDQLWGPSASRNAIDSVWAQTSKMKDLASGLTANHVVSALGLVSPDVSLLGLQTRVVKFLKTLTEFVEKNGGLNARIVLQLLGTEVGRAHDKRIWSNYTLRKAHELLEAGAPGVCITDGRFHSEVYEAKRAGALIWRIDSDTSLTGATHSSETEQKTIPDHMFDAILRNNKAYGLAALQDTVQRMAEITFSPFAFEVFESD